MVVITAVVVITVVGITTAVIVTTVAPLASGVAVFGARVTGVPVIGPATGVPVTGDQAGAITARQRLHTPRLLLRKGCGSKVTWRELHHRLPWRRLPIPIRSSGGIGVSAPEATTLTSIAAPKAGSA